METKESRVTNVQGNGTWETNDGTTFYKFEISMENGDSGEYYAKTQDQTKFKVGEVTAYTYKGGKFPKINPAWNPSNPGGGSSFDRESAIIRQTCIKAGAEIASSPEQAIHAAALFYTWIISETPDPKPEKESKENLPF